MLRSRGLGGLGLLAVGLGIGAAVASTPGVALADSSTDPFSWIGGIDLGDLLSAPAQTTSALDMQVSIDGMDLFPTAGNTATATSDIGDIAIAIGNGASATSLGLPTAPVPGASFGIFNFAFADGANSDASATGGLFDFAFADGANSDASATVGLFDSVFANGTGSTANADAVLNTATAFGPGSVATADFGELDTATAFGPGNVATAGVGNGDLATALGTNSDATAGGIGPFGPLGSNDFAFVLGTDSTATAGPDFLTSTPGNFDLAAAFGDMLHASALGSNFLVDIPPLPLF